MLININILYKSMGAIKSKWIFISLYTWYNQMRDSQLCSTLVGVLIYSHLPLFTTVVKARLNNGFKFFEGLKTLLE